MLKGKEVCSEVQKETPTLQLQRSADIPWPGCSRSWSHRAAKLQVCNPGSPTLQGAAYVFCKLSVADSSPFPIQSI